ncbi:hypothetical protein B0T26DRAFT_803666 [Lasiosphaeria miniovina]|uniref:Uncharacterized protein n=1 Tax=Lasiosphaeria miniovina TaxID=1954250 RepID=A0AA40DUU6_9PEZI|nr:uncharacterized protein B0T26DRAFT_803666 [Lasiosphaeria miniovina]KAK0712638.1 hypothetical protein B0T26DRAFT_803666 [Lasiosphaeria miniovina]
MAILSRLVLTLRAHLPHGFEQSAGIKANSKLRRGMLTMAGEQQQQPGLLVGFELEFMIATGSEDHYPDDLRWWFNNAHTEEPTLLSKEFDSSPWAGDVPAAVQAKVADIVTGQGLFFQNDTSASLRERDVAEQMQAAGIAPTAHVDWKHQGYSLTTDNTIKPSRAQEGEEWLGVELRSRAMPANNTTELDGVCRGLRAALRTQLSPSCALHVTVSRAQPVGLDLLAAKKALALV